MCVVNFLKFLCFCFLCLAINECYWIFTISAWLYANVMHILSVATFYQVLCTFAQFIMCITSTVQLFNHNVIIRGLRTFRSSALSFLGAKSPQMELSFPWNFRFSSSQE